MDPFPEARAAALAEALELPEEPQVCYACLSFVIFSLDGDDERETRRQLRRITQDLWHEGLDDIAFEAVEDARERGLPDAAAALRDLEQRAGRSEVARAIARRLAAEVGRRERLSMRVEGAARDRPPRPEWN